MQHSSQWAPVHFGPPASLGLIRIAPAGYGASAETVNALETVVLASQQLSQAISTVDFNALLDSMPVEHSSRHGL